MYPKLLDFKPLIMKSIEISLSRNSINPLIISKGSDQVGFFLNFFKNLLKFTKIIILKKKLNFIKIIKILLIFLRMF